MEKVHLLTLGCPKNLADSELMLGALLRAGFEVTLDPGEAQVLVVNTCAFIEAAKKESIGAILEASQVKRRGAGRRLVVAGCLAQRYGAELREELPEVDIFVGTGNFLDLPELLRRNNLWVHDLVARRLESRRRVKHFGDHCCCDGFGSGKLPKAAFSLVNKFDDVIGSLAPCPSLL